MAATSFNTSNSTYRQLMGNGLTYRVPRFQRDYSWGEEEWDDLWQDIQGAVKVGGEPTHYMGYLVLQSADAKQFDIIDGQQRLTTISIIVLAAVRLLKRLEAANSADSQDNGRRAEGLRQTYIGYVDPVSLVPRAKLQLNRNNDRYYQSVLVPTNEKPPVRGFKQSEHSLRKAYEWFTARIQQQSQGEKDPGRAIAQLIDTMSDRLLFTVITVADQLNAYKVFETLNARGVRLSATDLLKNYLFSVLDRDGPHDRELAALDDRWEGIVSRLGAESFPDFLRVHWISRRDFVRQTELFKVIRGQVNDRAEVFELLSGMEEDVDPYLALAEPTGSDWSPDAKRVAQNYRLFSVKQPYPLIIAARRILDETQFLALLRAVEVVSFRYNVIGNLQTSEQERAYAAVTRRLSKGEASKLADIIEGLRGVYPQDPAFRGSFAEKSIVTTQSRNTRVVRYVLCHLEKHLTGGALHDYQTDTVSIEHVCPTNPQDRWPQFSDEQVEAFADRLGNMTLLEPGTNKDLQNAEYTVKRPAFEKSSYQITKRLAADNVEWTPERIEARQRWMAEQATGIWRIAQLS